MRCIALFDAENNNALITIASAYRDTKNSARTRGIVLEIRLSFQYLDITIIIIYFNNQFFKSLPHLANLRMVLRQLYHPSL